MQRVRPESRWILLRMDLRGSTSAMGAVGWARPSRWDRKEPLVWDSTIQAASCAPVLMFQLHEPPGLSFYHPRWQAGVGCSLITPPATYPWRFDRAILSPDPSDTEPAVGLLGCFGPDYGPSYGRLIAGYSPYSYGWPVYAYGYTPTFVVHHPWEEHHAKRASGVLLSRARGKSARGWCSRGTLRHARRHGARERPPLRIGGS